MKNINSEKNFSEKCVKILLKQFNETFFELLSENWQIILALVLQDLMKAEISH